MRHEGAQTYDTCEKAKSFNVHILKVISTLPYKQEGQAILSIVVVIMPPPKFVNIK